MENEILGLQRAENADLIEAANRSLEQQQNELALVNAQFKSLQMQAACTNIGLATEKQEVERLNAFINELAYRLARLLESVPIK